MNQDQYKTLFDSIQKLIDNGEVSVDLGQKVITELNRIAKEDGIPLKFNVDDLEVTPGNYYKDLNLDHDSMGVDLMDNSIS